LRAIGWPVPGLYQDGRGPLRVRGASADGGYARPVRGAARFRNFDFDVDVHVNAHGYFERDATPKVAGEYRIGLFGDSTTSGWGVGHDGRYGRVWFEAVRDRMPGASMWNFGAPGQGTWQNETFLRRHGDVYELDEVILAFYAGNDINDNARWVHAPTIPVESAWDDIEDWLAANLRSVTFLWSNALRLRAAFTTDPIPLQPALVERLWPETEQALDAMRRTAGDRPLTIWYMPYFTEWDDVAWAEARRRHGLREEDRFVVRDRVTDWCRRRDVAVVDMTPFMEGRPVDSLRLPVDRHWNALAHRLVGEGLAREPACARLCE
jgi:hypothetical protein